MCLQWKMQVFIPLINFVLFYGLKAWKLTKTMEKIPDPSRQHETNIRGLILDIMDSYGIDDEVERPLRQEIVNRLNAQLLELSMKLTDDIFLLVAYLMVSF